MDIQELIIAALDSWNLDDAYKAWLYPRVLEHSAGVIYYVEDHARQFNVWIDWKWFDLYLDKYVLNYILVYDNSYLEIGKDQNGLQP